MEIVVTMDIIIKVIVMEITIVVTSIVTIAFMGSFTDFKTIIKA